MKNNTIHIIFINILMLTQICFASPYPPLTGNPSEATWTMYLSSATLNGQSLEAGDAIGVFDDSRLVGSFKLTEVLSKENQYKNYITVWSALNDDVGYTKNNQYTIKCWDSDQQIESTSYSIQFDSSVSNNYKAHTFPQADGVYSVASLMFTSENTKPTNHFKTVSGDPSQATWTIYLAQANLDFSSLQVNDEIAVFFNSTQVGFYKVNQELSHENWKNQYINVFSVLADSVGYSPGQPFEFRLWDDSDKQVYSLCSLAFVPTEGAYEGQAFPSGDAPYSVIRILFDKHICSDAALKERLRYDPSGDGQIGLEEAIHALQVMSGM